MIHPNDRKWRGIKEPLDEGERGELKSWLKTQNSKNKDHGIWSPHFMANRWGKMETVTGFIFLGHKTTVAAAMKFKYTCFLEENLWET